MFEYSRRLVLTGAFLLLAACGGGADEKPGTVPLSSPSDIPYGSADAPVTLVEYAALTCGACGYFNNSVLSEIKSDYVDTGKVKIVTREMLYPAPVEINLAGFALARCAGDDKHHDVIDDIFQNQTGILSAVRAGAGSQALQAVAERHGLDKAAFDACIADPEIKDQITAVATAAQNAGVTRTPTLFLNGRELKGASAQTAEGLAEILDAELAKSE